MSVLIVPKYDEEYPSLGPQVYSFIKDNLVHGPGDLRGLPIELDEEKQALITRMYEVYPKGHAWAGRRRFKRCAISLRKGSAKTELAALIAAVELHPKGPVRCNEE
jgi:phage terminase large subunit-like protein